MEKRSKTKGGDLKKKLETSNPNIPLEEQKKPTIEEKAESTEMSERQKKDFNHLQGMIKDGIDTENLGFQNLQKEINEKYFTKPEEKTESIGAGENDLEIQEALAKGASDEEIKKIAEEYNNTIVSATQKDADGKPENKPEEPKPVTPTTPVMPTTSETPKQPITPPTPEPPSFPEQPALEEQEETSRWKKIKGLFGIGKKKEKLVDLETQPAFITNPLSPEEIGNLEQILADVKQQRMTKMDHNWGGKILKGFDYWENFGKNEDGSNEKGWGFVKRMGKTAVNLALIGLVSSLSVEKLAQAGVGTATALSGGITSYFGRKLGIGLAVGGTMDLMGGSKLSPKIKKALPYIMAGGSIALATFATGGVAGVAAGLSFGAGLAASKIYKGQFTKVKIEEREKNAKQNLINELKAKGETINEADLAKFEKDCLALIKKYERMRVWGRLVDGAIKLAIGSTVSALSLELSGAARDHLEEHRVEQMQADLEKHIKAEMDNNSKLETAAQEKTYAEDLTKSIDELNKEALADAKNIVVKLEPYKVETHNETNLPTEEAIKIDGSADELLKGDQHGTETNIKPEPLGGEHPDGSPQTSEEIKADLDAKMQTDLEDSSNINAEAQEKIDTETLQQIDDQIKTDLDNSLQEAQEQTDTERIQQEIEDDLYKNIPENEPTNVEPEPTQLSEAHAYAEHQTDLRGEAEAQVQTEIREEGLINDGTQDNSLMNDHALSQNDHVGHQAEYDSRVEAKYDELHQADLRSEAEAQIQTEIENNDFHLPSTDTVDHQAEQAEFDAKVEARIHELQQMELKHEEVLKQEAEMAKNETLRAETEKVEAEHAKAEAEAKQLEDLKNDIKITAETKEEYEHIEHKIFPDEKSIRMWDQIKDSTSGQSAEKLLHRDMAETSDTFKPLVSVIQQLHNITGIEPRGESLLTGPAESGREYIMHALKEVIKMDKLDKLKL